MRTLQERYRAGEAGCVWGTHRRGTGESWLRGDCPRALSCGDKATFNLILKNTKKRRMNGKDPADCFQKKVSEDVSCLFRRMYLEKDGQGLFPKPLLHVPLLICSDRMARPRRQPRAPSQDESENS